MRLAASEGVAYQIGMQGTLSDLTELATRLEALAREAGEIAMGFFRPGERTSASVGFKSGGSPVSEADVAVDRFLFEGMASLFPEAGWLSEESADSAERLSRRALVVVDPIDGTTAFVRGDPRWAVSIALVENGRPVAGVVHAPALGKTFSARRSGGAFLNGVAIAVSGRSALEGASLVAPRGLACFLENSAYGFHLEQRKPSLALRIVDVAMGVSDVVIAGPNSRDWDIAAADVILTEAGGVLSELDGGALTYNRPTSRRETLVAAPKALLEESLALAKAAQKGR
jgi:myo-inositol-1(or 4)-monophosphatase